jgi:hypothetical protein
MDMEYVDGYDTLPADAQAKVKRALEQGHVDDDDWNGVSEPLICISSLSLTVLRTCSAIDSPTQTSGVECL